MARKTAHSDLTRNIALSKIVSVKLWGVRWPTVLGGRRRGGGRLFQEQTTGLMTSVISNWQDLVAAFATRSSAHRSIKWRTCSAVTQRKLTQASKLFVPDMRDWNYGQYTDCPEDCRDFITPCKKKKSERRKLKLYARQFYSKLFLESLTAQVKRVQATLPLSAPWKHIRGAELELHSFLTLTLDRGEWSTSRPGRSRDRTPIPIEQETGCTPKLIRMLGTEKSPLPLQQFKPGFFKLNSFISNLSDDRSTASHHHQ